MHVFYIDDDGDDDDDKKHNDDNSDYEYERTVQQCNPVRTNITPPLSSRTRGRTPPREVTDNSAADVISLASSGSPTLCGYGRDAAGAIVQQYLQQQQQQHSDVFLHSFATLLQRKVRVRSTESSRDTKLGLFVCHIVSNQNFPFLSPLSSHYPCPLRS